MEEQIEKKDNKKKILMILIIIIMVVSIIIFILFITRDRNKNVNNTNETVKQVINITENVTNNTTKNTTKNITKNTTTEIEEKIYYEDDNYLVKYDKNKYGHQLYNDSLTILNKNTNEYYTNENCDENDYIYEFFKDDNNYFIYIGKVPNGKGAVTLGDCETIIINITTGEILRSITGSTDNKAYDNGNTFIYGSMTIKPTYMYWSIKLENNEIYHNQKEHFLTSDDNIVVLNDNNISILNKDAEVLKTFTLNNIMDNTRDYFITYENNNVNLYKYEGTFIITAIENIELNNKALRIYDNSNKTLRIVGIEDNNAVTEYVYYNIETGELTTPE